MNASSKYNGHSYQISLYESSFQIWVKNSIASRSYPLGNKESVPPFIAPIETPTITSYINSSGGNFSRKAFKTPTS